MCMISQKNKQVKYCNKRIHLQAGAGMLTLLVKVYTFVRVQHVGHVSLYRHKPKYVNEANWTTNVCILNIF